MSPLQNQFEPSKLMPYKLHNLFISLALVLGLIVVIHIAFMLVSFPWVLSVLICWVFLPIVIIWTNWKDLYVDVPQDTWYIYRFRLFNRIGPKSYIIAPSGINFLIIWLMVREDMASAKKDIIFDIPVIGTSSDGAKISVSVTINLKVDRHNPGQWIYTGSNDTEREAVVRQAFAALIKHQVNSLIRGYTRDELLKGKEKLTDGVWMRGIDSLKLRIVQSFLNAQSAYEYSYGVYVVDDALSINTVAGDAEMDKAMQQLLITGDLTAAATALVRESGDTMTFQEAHSRVLMIADEVDGQMIKLDVAPEVAAALASAMQNGGVGGLAALRAGQKQAEQGNRNQGQGRRRRRGQGGGGPT